MIRRVHHFVDKNKIQIAIDKYDEYKNRSLFVPRDEEDTLWSQYIDALRDICPDGNWWVCACDTFQAMKWSGVLDVEHVYYAILAMGVNIKLVEVGND